MWRGPAGDEPPSAHAPLGGTIWPTPRRHATDLTNSLLSPPLYVNLIPGQRRFAFYRSFSRNAERKGASADSLISRVLGTDKQKMGKWKPLARATKKMSKSTPRGNCSAEHNKTVIKLHLHLSDEKLSCLHARATAGSREEFNMIYARALYVR